MSYLCALLALILLLDRSDKDSIIELRVAKLHRCFISCQASVQRYINRNTLNSFTIKPEVVPVTEAMMALA